MLTSGESIQYRVNHGLRETLVAQRYSLDCRCGLTSLPQRRATILCLGDEIIAGFLRSIGS